MSTNAPLTFLDLFRQEAARADGAEADLRARYTEELRGLERTRVFANRRLALVMALCAAVEGADDDAAAYAAGERALRDEVHLTRESEAHVPLIDAFRPVIDVVDTLLNCEDEAEPTSVGEALARFEATYKERTGSDFLALYDVYVPETPLVDF